MTAEQAVELLDLLSEGVADAWVDGGWGIETLVREAAPAEWWKSA